MEAFFMDELIDILNEEGKLTGKTAMKTEAHKNGWFHQTIHVWFYNANGEILLQQRGKNKAVFPLLWDVSVAGHIGAGEEITLSAIRETQEEIGLTVSENDLEKIGVFKSIQRHHSTLIDCEFHHVFLCELTVSIAKLIKQETEVQQLQLVALHDFKNGINNVLKYQYVPHETTYYHAILKAITRRIK